MDDRAAKLANARKKLRDHQEKKSVCTQKDGVPDVYNSEVEDYRKCQNQSMITKDEVNIINNNHNVSQPDAEEIIVINHDAPSPSNNGYANVTEILISTKTNLEMQNKELECKIVQLENIYSIAVNENNLNKQKLTVLELELNETIKKNSLLMESNSALDSTITELKSQIKSLMDDKNSLVEQQEIAQTILTAKEMEIAQQNSQLSYLQNQIDVMTVQLQQLTSDASFTLNEDTSNDKANEILMEKIAMLKHQLENSSKEKDLITSHYEHYVSKLNEQLNLQITKNQTLSTEVHALQNREHSLIEQIGQIEIRMQNYRSQTEEYSELNSTYKKDLKDKVAAIQAELDVWINKYNDLQKQHEMSLHEIQELNKAKTQQLNYENISITKLNEDITSDKVAAQRATEQNKKLKVDVEELEQIVIKLGKDKLELTEKLSHEKQLNKQLMLKLADIDETSKQMHTKLLAKDEEMIRLQSNYRDIENKHETLLENLLQEKESAVTKSVHTEQSTELKNNGDEEYSLQLIKPTKISECLDSHACRELNNGNELPKEDAMFKLQERFLNIMDQVANLSDEKHRLEHIILQLQTETDTICEYVALYQQQRSLLKKRDEERSAQIKLFEMECDAVKRELEELSKLFLKLAQDKDLSTHLQVEARHNDVAKIKNLLENLLNSSLINSKSMSLELKNFYPCSCCSGQLIDV